MPRRRVHRSRCTLFWLIRRTYLYSTVDPRLLTALQFADVNAFLTFAATRHTYTPEHLQSHPRVAPIMEAAKAGHVPVHLVSSTSMHLSRHLLLEAVTLAF
jgi:hypothetical protein